MTIDKYLHMGSKYIIKYIHKRTPQSSRGSLIVQEDSSTLHRTPQLSKRLISPSSPGGG